MVRKVFQAAEMVSGAFLTDFGEQCLEIAPPPYRTWPGRITIQRREWAVTKTMLQPVAETLPPAGMWARRAALRTQARIKG